MYNLAMEYDGLKFRKEIFKFGSKKKYNEFFNNALIESPYNFIRESKQEFDEKIHIAFSWMTILKILSWTFMGLTALMALANIAWLIPAVLITLSFGSRLISNGFKNRIDDLAFGKAFVIEMYEMNNYENLAEIRKELIEEKKQNDETPE